MNKLQITASGFDFLTIIQPYFKPVHLSQGNWETDGTWSQYDGSINRHTINVKLSNQVRMAHRRLGGRGLTGGAAAATAAAAKTAATAAAAVRTKDSERQHLRTNEHH
jgi:hypothetical protein